MADETNTILVKHLPGDLTVQEQKDLLQHFGAKSVKCMGNKGPLRYCAFASFENREAAETAVKRLHQLELLDHVLSAEFAKKQQKRHFPPAIKDEKNKKCDEKGEAEKPSVVPPVRKNEIADNINSISAKWGVEYTYNPHLEYMYPPPSVTVLTNIANALASVPKFYVQVLHLMNKLNLPAPFGAVTATPPLPQEESIPPVPPEPMDTLPQPDIPEASTEESELESDEEDKNKLASTQPKPVKRPSTSKVKKVRKKPKLQDLISVPHVPKDSKTAVYKPEEIFETPNVTQARKLDIRVGIQTELIASSNVQEPPLVPEPVDLLSVIENVQHGEEKKQHEEQGTGFGIFEPQKKEEGDTESAGEEEEWGESEFISDRKLRKYRLSEREMRDYSVFRNYSSGEPTSRLYIKNVAKQVVEKDLHHIYGKYVDWEKEDEKIMFDIRLMKEGRMKGQAFVTLPNETVAKAAVRQTNAYMLEGKPLVVQFARSAKPKENDDKGKKKK